MSFDVFSMPRMGVLYVPWYAETPVPISAFEIQKSSRGSANTGTIEGGDVYRTVEI